MVPEKTCIDPDCRSDDQHRKAPCRGLCRNCYMRLWRRGRRSDSQVRADRSAASRSGLLKYKQRNLPRLRQREVQRLLDEGRSEEEVVTAFLEDDELFKYVSDLGDPVKAIKRDIDRTEADEAAKSAMERMLEREIRQARLVLRTQSARHAQKRDHKQLVLHLHELEAKLARVTDRVTDNDDFPDDEPNGSAGPTRGPYELPNVI